ncbi:SRPBCC family protein [Nocardioides gilvus]|uniref:SRPBCC family protein n=1 Tax=Nocardioides gilvus TaxID=1735589 RepID=UPI001EF4D161|nr:SRPBCC family protein [Nocardioides gilvus]
MLRARHQFRETWTVAAPPEEVAAVLGDLEFYPQWWPQVVAVAALGEDRARVLCRSRLPYTLDLVLTAVTRRAPTLRVDVEGDLVGHVRFDLVEEGLRTRLDFHQDVTVSGWLALASQVGRPALHWNHAQMMRGCREGLAARLG